VSAYETNKMLLCDVFCQKIPVAQIRMNSENEYRGTATFRSRVGHHYLCSRPNLKQSY